MEAPLIRRRLQELRAAVIEHKTAIRLHREQLHAAKTALVAFEADLRQHGIAVVQFSTGVAKESSHGHRTDS